MLWIRAFHIIAMVAWFAGLFYLPRLFVYHADSHDAISQRRFCTMEHKLFFYIMNPAALITLALGLWLLLLNFQDYLSQGWMHAKLALVLLLVCYHGYCGVLLLRFAHQQNRHSAKFYRFFNEGPTLLLIAIVILVTVKP